MERTRLCLNEGRDVEILMGAACAHTCGGSGIGRSLAFEIGLNEQSCCNVSRQGHGGEEEEEEEHHKHKHHTHITTTTTTTSPSSSSAGSARGETHRRSSSSTGMEWDRDAKIETHVAAQEQEE